MTNAKPKTHRTPGAVIYTRVSGDDQDKHGTSPETQRDVCRAKALALSLPIVAEYYDGGISGGFLLARPGMQAALADIKAGRADTLICATMDRYSRDVEHQHRIRREVREAGGRVLFCDMDFEDTPEGDLNFTIYGGFKAYEKTAIRKRTLNGRIKRAEEGLQPARTHSPFGYKIVSKADVLRGDQPAALIGRYLILDGEAVAVRFLFEAYAAGTHSLTGLTRWLNATGVPCRQRATFWSVSSVSYILSNPVYKGVGAYGKRDHGQDEARLTERHPHTGLPLKTVAFDRPADPKTWITWDVPALVSEETWEAVQARSAENRRLKGGNPRTVRMLAGRVFCAHCGAGLVVKRSDTRRAKKHPEEDPARDYACGTYLRRLVNTGERGCVPTHYKIEAVESGVRTILEEAAQNPLAVRDALTAYAEPPAEGDGHNQAQELDRVEALLRALEARQAAVVQAQIAGIAAGAAPTAYDAAFAAIAQERADLRAKQEALSKSPSAARRAGMPFRTGIGFPQILGDLCRVLASPVVTGPEKRDLLANVIERVYPSKEGVEVAFLPGVFADGGTQTPSDTTLQPYLFSIIRASALKNRRPMPQGLPADYAAAPGYQPYQ